MLLIIITDSEKWEYSLFMSDLGQGRQAWNVARILNKEKEIIRKENYVACYWFWHDYFSE